MSEEKKEEPVPVVADGAKPKGPAVLVLGGSGFIGRNFVKFMVDNKLSQRIYVADKSPPMLCHFSDDIKAAFDSEFVEFKQTDLAQESHVKRCFAAGPFQFVVNLCGETRFGLGEKDYSVKCFDTAALCAKEAAAAKVEKFVEVSHAQVYQSSAKRIAKEDSPLKPWTVQAQYRLKAEAAVRATENLPSVVLRPTYVYGPGDKTGLTPRIVVGAVYQKKKEKMQLLWGKDLAIHTVHVHDVCKALWIACTKAKPGSVYNLSDEGKTTQGMISNILNQLMGIKVSFYGKIISNLAKLKLKDIAADANEMHLPTWINMCRDAGINNTPIDPYIDIELLRDNSLNVDGSKICSEFDFKYDHKVTVDSIRDQIKFFQANKHFPEIDLK